MHFNTDISTIRLDSVVFKHYYESTIKTVIFYIDIDESNASGYVYFDIGDDIYTIRKLGDKCGSLLMDKQITDLLNTLNDKLQNEITIKRLMKILKNLAKEYK